MADRETVLFEHPMENGELLRASVSTFKGKTYIGIRRWWKDDSGEWKPGKNGINVQQGPDLRHLREAFDAVNKWASEP